MGIESKKRKAGFSRQRQLSANHTHKHTHTSQTYITGNKKGIRLEMVDIKIILKLCKMSLLLKLETCSKINIFIKNNCYC